MTNFLIEPPEDLRRATERLYVAGAEALRASNWTAAFQQFNSAYRLLLKSQPFGRRLHKGLPLHNMGLARLGAGRPRGALKYTLFAFLEDAMSKADEEARGLPELDMPAANNLLYVFGLEPRLLSNIANRIRALAVRERTFRHPEELAEELDLVSMYSSRAKAPTTVEQPRRPNPEELVRERLERAQIPFRSDVSLGGLQVDVVVETNHGPIILEVKQPQGQLAMARLAESNAQIDAIRAITRARAVFLVVPDDARVPSALAGRIVPVGQVVGAVRAIQGDEVAEPHKFETEARLERPRIFVAMPFGRAYHDTFYNAIVRAAKAVKASAVRVDHAPRSGDIVLRIKTEIERAAIVIADVSDARPSVLHEYGYAEAGGKPVIAITSTGIPNLPFNVSHNTTLEYEKGATEVLRKDLVPILRRELRRLGLAMPAELN